MTGRSGPSPGLVIFDCDGVLVDSEPIGLAILLHTLAEAGLPLDPAVAQDRFLGRSLASTVAILAADFGLLLDDAALGAMRARLYDAFRAELRPITGIAETLQRLACPVCVASSSQPERIELSLRVTGLWPRFAGGVFSATMVEHGKPAPDLFLHAARIMGFAPRDCLVVEDSPAGVLAAQAAGMRVIGFVGGGHARGAAHRAALAALGPERVIEDMRALAAIANGD
ncbi:MAG: HAD family hydrolase [Rhodobacteraceae bacterium]|nr:HAD family hydrolase [Paracoccaceae bacterium]